MLFEIKSHRFPPQDIRVLSCTYLSHYLYALENTLVVYVCVCMCMFSVCFNIQFCVSAGLASCSLQPDWSCTTTTISGNVNEKFKETIYVSNRQEKTDTTLKHIKWIVIKKICSEGFRLLDCAWKEECLSSFLKETLPKHSLNPFCRPLPVGRALFRFLLFPPHPTP